MPPAPTASKGAGFVLLVLAAGQFLMTLDSSVMNVSMAQVAADLDTTVTGIQTAITLYTLVMASLMLTGGKVGVVLGRRRAFAIGLVIYATGSLTTALAPNLTVLIIGWSFLEGIGAALIMPAIVALVAANFPPSGRARAYGLIAAAGAMAVAAGPIIGGAVTTFASWRYVFLGEVVIVIGILAVIRRIKDTEPAKARLDLVGSGLSIVGLGALVFGVLRSSEWGWVQPKQGAPSLFGISPTLWLIVGGLLVVYVFFRWETRLERGGREPLLRPTMLRNNQLVGGLTMFFFQFLVQAGVFFAVPLFLSVALELTALQTGARLLPLSAALLIAAAGIPKAFPNASPRRVVRIGMVGVLAGTLLLLAGVDVGADAAVVLVPMLFLGFGLGALASQLGGVTVSAVPDKESGEVGGLQNTVTNLGASFGTALIGSVLIASLSTAFIQGVQQNPAIPDQVKTQATTQLTGSVPFISDTDLTAALDDAGVPPDVQEEIVEVNEAARIRGLDAAFALAALFAAVALFFTGRIPTRPPGSAAVGDQPSAVAATGGA